DVEIHAPALVRCGNVEAAAVPADAPARQPAHAAVGAFGDEGAGDGPVVRQGDRLPVAVVEIRAQERHVADVGFVRGTRVARGGVGDEAVGGGQDPWFEHGTVGVDVHRL